MAKRKPKDKRQENVSEAQPDRELSKDVVQQKQIDEKQADKKQIDTKKADKKQNNDKKIVDKQVDKKQDNVKQDLPAAEKAKEISEHEVFTGDKDFYKLLSESQQSDAKQQAGEQQPQLKISRRKSFTLLQKIIAAGIILITAVLLFIFFGLKTDSASDPRLISAGQLPSFEQGDLNVRPAKTDSKNAESTQTAKQGDDFLQKQPISLKVARDFFKQKNYQNAYLVYDRLYEALPISEVMLRDFIHLQMAQCLEINKDYEQASRFYVMISESPSPVVRIIANYHLSLLEIRRKRYLYARTRAYKALALVKSVDFDNDWELAFECDCYFLAAESLTRYVLSLNNADSDIPENLWTKPNISMEPFGDMGEEQLRLALKSGSEHINAGLLDPKIARLEDRDFLPRWSVTSYGAPIEELLAKIAAVADIDVQWAFERSSELNSEPELLRLSPTTVHLPSLTTEQIVLIAAGCTGLLARSEEDSGKYKVTVYNPADYSSLNEHVSFLGQHAISLWRKYILMFNSEKRLGNAHFAMGLLQAQTDMAAEAIGEYKLVANRFSQTSLAPYAFLHSSRIKTELRDYRGAREDLKQLIEQYPDTEIHGRAYLRLADVTKMAGLYGEAAQLYCRVYNFGLTDDSKAASAFGAAVCFYQFEAFQDTVMWLERYLDVAKSERSNYLYSAYFLLGKANLALGNFEQASAAFQIALTEQTSREQYVEAVKALVQGQIEQENFLEALDALENAHSVALSEEQSVEMLLLKSTVYRMLGLVDYSIDSLRNRAEYVTDTKLRTKITFELARCYFADGDLELARSSYSDVLRAVEPGPMAESAALELAEVCLELGQSSQSISVCLQLLDSDLPEQTKQKALKTLADAYNHQKDYDKAALALSNQW
jgi:tetratricopeptide (TPR) repeat protein